MTTILIDFLVPQLHSCYSAHFPNNPIVPGALLLQWIIRYADKNYDENIIGIKSFKFIAPVRPGDRCSVNFSLMKSDVDNENIAIKVCCSRGSEIVCKGVLLSGNKSLSALL